MKKNLCEDKKCPNYGRYSRYCNHFKAELKEVKTPNKVSESQKETLKEYSKVRKAYLDKHPVCQAQLQDCQKVAIEVHHKKGKATREDYLNPKFFLAVCRNCHNLIENNTAFAKAMGLSVSRHHKGAA